jgi:hypothetical protein
MMIDFFFGLSFDRAKSKLSRPPRSGPNLQSRYHALFFTVILFLEVLSFIKKHDCRALWKIPLWLTLKPTHIYMHPIIAPSLQSSSSCRVLLILLLKHNKRKLHNRRHLHSSTTCRSEGLTVTTTMLAVYR